MYQDLVVQLAAGAVLVLAAFTVLVTLVRRDLTPQGALAARGRLWLACGLGGGILAFTFKLAAIALMLAFDAQRPRRFAPPLAAMPAATATGATAERPLAGRYVWTSLPATAPTPNGEPLAPRAVALGRRLFEDRRLSRDGTLACASCHDVERGAGIDGRRVATGVDGRTGTRNVPTVWNAAFQSRFFWDGRAGSLEAQALGPIVNPVEMAMPTLAAAVAIVANDADYRREFAALGDAGRPITAERIAAAIAAYERTLIASDTPYDRFVRGDARALDARALRGLALFESVGCVRCHAGPNFSAASVFDPSAPWRLFPAHDSELAAEAGLTTDKGTAPPDAARGVWRVPSLRNVALTAPYFHNGAVATLEEAVRIMANAQLGRPARAVVDGGREAYWSPAAHAAASVERQPLTDAEVGDLVAFLRALSSDRLAAAQAR
ncbi:MAG: c-type cytochrome [Gammaproteobacteria bacterium]|nr:c-type cytochrome [Gammaproteobacteria bacterium]